MKFYFKVLSFFTATHLDGLVKKKQNKNLKNKYTLPLVMKNKSQKYKVFFIYYIAKKLFI